MLGIEYSAPAGSRRIILRVTNIVGNSKFWAVTIDDYWEGDMFCRDGCWRLNGGRNSMLTTDDVDAISELLDSNFTQVNDWTWVKKI